MNAHGVDVDLGDVSFFLGRESLVFTGKSNMSLPRKIFFKLMSQNAVAASAFFKLPPGRVIELGMQVEI
jgi:KUP system potassium uptake protein